MITDSFRCIRIKFWRWQWIINIESSSEGCTTDYSKTEWVIFLVWKNCDTFHRGSSAHVTNSYLPGTTSTVSIRSPKFLLCFPARPTRDTDFGELTEDHTWDFRFRSDLGRHRGSRIKCWFRIKFMAYHIFRMRNSCTKKCSSKFL